MNSLWVGSELSELELLTICSFIENGHEFHLWLYDMIDNVPDTVRIKNANEIIPENKVFRYPRDSKIDWGQGSYAGFSDIFRYKLLYEVGGWWVDMDMTCLKSFDFEGDYFFRDHWKLDVVGNAMKCPKGSEIMKNCYEQAVHEIDEFNESWHKPIEILNDHIKRLDLMRHRKKGLFNSDHAFKLKKYFNRQASIPDKWYGIHWINSAGKLSYKENSTFHKLLIKHGIE